MKKAYSKAWILLFTFFQLSSFAQSNHIQGYLKTIDGKPVAAATVSLKNIQKKIVAYKLSDDKGYFTLSFSDTISVNSLVIEIGHLGYKKVTQSLVTNNTTYNILMEPQEINLEEIEIKSQVKVRSRNDTVKYNVEAFTKTEDRTIGDVISRMPGLEVSESGQIKFNGQGISNLYINGDDLLNDKYAIGTKTIPSDMVRTLEVMKNHQPKKVLQDKTLSNDIAINLIIKDEAKIRIANQLKIGMGLPEQYDGELNTILFNNKFKTLSVLKGNNIGIDLTTDFTSFDYSQQAVSHPDPLLSPGTVGPPPLSKQRYYFNNSGSLNTNNLINLKDSLQLKVNVNMLIDRNSMTYSSRSETYLANDTISYTEFQGTTNKPFITEAALTLEANKSRYFLNNSLKFTYNQDQGLSELMSNDRNITQRIGNRVRDFSNTFSYTPELRNKNTISFNWYLSHFNRPQSLLINPGINETALNNGRSYNEIYQSVEIPTWVNRLSLSYLYAKGIIKQTYEAGVVSEIQELLSNLSLTQANGELTKFLNNHDNDLKWNKQQVFGSVKYEYKKERWEGTLFIPVTLQHIGYKDAGFGLNNNRSQVLVTPNLRIKYYVSSEDFVTFNYGYANQIGNIMGVYRGVILQNYRTLQANDAQLQEQNTHQSGIQFNLQRSAQMLFVSIGLGYDKTLANTISSSIITNDIMQTVVLPVDNNITTMRANIGISKFINLIGSTANLKILWNSSRLDQIQNNDRLSFNNISFVVNPGLEIQLHKDLRLRYSANGTWFTSKQDAFETAKSRIGNIKMRMYEQAARLTWILYKSIDVQVNLRHNSTEQANINNINYLFADASVRYKINKWKTDLELNAFNLTNVRSFETYMLSSNSLWQSRYELRERMILLKAVFTL